MNRKIVYYRWGAVNDSLFKQALAKTGIPYIEYSRKMEDYHADSAFSLEFVRLLHTSDVKAVFSYDYFPLLSMLCEINHIPYISWIYDCPMRTLQSETIKSPANYIFCFDAIETERLKKRGAVNCYHFPLAGDSSMLVQVKKSEQEDTSLKRRFSSDISFVGSLYNEEKNRVRNAVFDEYTVGYLEGLIQAQLQIYGYNFIKESLSDAIVEELVRECKLQLGDMYQKDDIGMAADAIGMEVSARERENVLDILSNHFSVRLYTGSQLPASLNKQNLQVAGYVDYEKEMPHIFHNSKVNLNITSRTIESGIPLRVFDILSCGGFCLTNYQPEVAELFEDGRDLVMYSDMKDLVRKVDYYLTHEEERQQIAQNGYHKIKEQYDLPNVLKELFGYFD